MKARGLGWEWRLTYILPVGIYDFEGVSAEFAFSYGIPVADKTLIEPKVGVIGFAGGDNDGSPGGDVGFFLALGFSQRLTGAMVLRGDVAQRFFVAIEGGSLGGSLGLLFRL